MHRPRLRPFAFALLVAILWPAQRGISRAQEARGTDAPSDDAFPAAAGAFEPLGIPVRVGGLMGCLVGPAGKGPGAAGGEALFFNFNQLSGNLFLVQVDPETGEARQFDAPEGPGAWAQVVGPDGRIYLGTWSGALILRFDPEAPERGIEVVGKPSPTEDYIWQYAVAPDGWIYGCTYPNAKLIRFRPADAIADVAMEDLGRMHPTEMYARSVAVAPSGHVYVGIGTTTGDLVVFDPVTKEHRSILPPGLSGAKGWSTVGVATREDGSAWAEFGPNLIRLKGETATVVETGPNRPTMRLKDGRAVAFERGAFTLTTPAVAGDGASQPTSVRRTFQYAGAGDRIFMLGEGPGGVVYGSTAMPLEVFRHDPAEKDKAKANEHLGAMPGGEVYSMLARGDRLYMCYYGGSVMNLYDPARAWAWGSAEDSNPRSFGGVGDGHLRPRAMVPGPGGAILVGSEPPYGELGGALGFWDPETNRNVRNHRNLVQDQSIVSLAWDERSGLIYGGSAIQGGGGTTPKAKEAVFFAFDPKADGGAGRKVFEAALRPGAREYEATLVVGGRVLTTAGDRLYVLETGAAGKDSLKVEREIELPGGQLPTSMGLLPAGDAASDDAKSELVVGLTSRAVYVLDVARGKIVHVAKAPVPIRCGFARADGAVYFGSDAALWRYRLPDRFYSALPGTTAR